MMLPKSSPVRSKALRESAQGQTCTLRLPGICAGGTETTVLAHLPFGGRGMGRKASDLHAVHACASCHDMLDQRQRPAIDRDELLECCVRGLAETHDRLRYMGLLNVKGDQ